MFNEDSLKKTKVDFMGNYKDAMFGSKKVKKADKRVSTKPIINRSHIFKRTNTAKLKTLKVAGDDKIRI